MGDRSGSKPSWTIGAANDVFAWIQRPTDEPPVIDGVVPGRLADVGLSSLEAAHEKYKTLVGSQATALALYVAGFNNKIWEDLGLDYYVKKLQVAGSRNVRAEYSDGEAAPVPEVVTAVAEEARLDEAGPVMGESGVGETASVGMENGPVSPVAAQLSSILGYDPHDGQLAWQELALCAQTDPEAFFPEKGGSTREAKAVCKNCEVREECLDYALRHNERFGIWGGLSERERRKLMKVPEFIVDEGAS